MGLGKEQESAIFSVYNAYWDNYLTGDVEGMASLLAEEYTQVGSAETEVFANKRDAVQFLYDTIDQVTGKLQMRNRQTTMESLDGLVIVHERCDVYVLADGVWSFYARFRATTLMQERKGGWKIIHQHSSFPDARTGEGENIATEQIAAENQQLKEAVRRQTVELRQRNRDLEIDAALERVRSRAMSMQQSSELGQLIETVYREMGALDFKLQRCFIMIFDRANDGYTWWMASDEIGVNQRGYYIPYSDHAPQVAYVRGWKERNERWSYYLHGEVKRQWDEYLFNDTELSQLPPQGIAGMRGTEAVHLYSSFSNFGCICAGTVEPLDGDYFDVLVRFAKVFDQTYTRFLDLKLAEEQAREANIQLALERVRARTMAMQKSEELTDVAELLFKKVAELGITTWTTGFNVWHDDGIHYTDYVTNPTGGFMNPYTVDTSASVVLAKLPAARRSGSKYYVNFEEGEELAETYRELLRYGPDQFKSILESGFEFPRQQYEHFVFGSKVSLMFITYEAVPEEWHDIFRRFGNVFEQTYTRFLDLKTAETQAHRARIETALERVRARALAMQEPEELVDVARVLRQEMGQLGVEALETGTVFIHDAGTDTAECWFAIKEQKHADRKLIADHIRLDLNATWVGKQMLAFFERDDVQVSIPMRGQHRKEWIEYCYGLSPILDGYYGAQIPDRVYHLYKFSNGAIGAAAPGDISPESWELLQRTASVFSLAYSRFRDLSQARTDLQRLKEEKNRAEAALAELRATQAQLIQAEKMASLGELTAGIAHEIQNPLNFVNNFSDLNRELLDELKEEIDKGDMKEAVQILENIRDNESKINLHGKRADGIVKSMLQHSRSSTGQKEPTDINALADEYLRLAYHGLRAKDKTFNTAVETDLDPFIGTVHIIPQDIGRVLLNLYNNAFYAVNERKKTAALGYEPRVSVGTKKSGDSIEIRVTDNGMGIPENLREKIFQPFFTTKPTGQGTGLGLSMSYDIVTKGHGGTLQAVSTVGEGTMMTITLPIASTISTL